MDILISTTEAPAEALILTEVERATFEAIARELGGGVLHTIEARAVGDAEDGEDPVTYPVPPEHDEGDDEDDPPLISGAPQD